MKIESYNCLLLHIEYLRLSWQVSIISRYEMVAIFYCSCNLLQKTKNLTILNFTFPIAFNYAIDVQMSGRRRHLQKVALNRNGWEKLVDGASSKSQYFWKSRIIDETSTVEVKVSSFLLMPFKCQMQFKFE